MNELVFMHDKEAMTTSLLVAEKFHKQHKVILRRIDGLIEDMRTAQNCAVQNEKVLFSRGYYVNAQNKRQPMYYMNRDGFMLLAMGLTGKEALKWKLDFIKLFDNMEEFIRVKLKSALEQQLSMRTLHDNLKDPTPKDYIKANQITNKAVSSIHGYAKSIKKENMTEEMLQERDKILNDTVELMAMKEKFNLDIHVSEKIYEKYC